MNEKADFSFLALFAIGMALSPAGFAQLPPPVCTAGNGGVLNCNYKAVGSVEVNCPGIQEVVGFTGVDHLVTAFQLSEDGLQIILLHGNFDQTRAVGLSTGIVYQFQSIMNFQAGAGPGGDVNSLEARFRLSNGGNSAVIVAKRHWIALPNGIVTVQFDSFTSTCG